MKIGLVTLGLAGILALSGCAVDGAGEGALDESLENGGTDDGVSVLGETFSLNCGSSLPGLPKPPCLPELLHTQVAAQVVAPGGNLAPGHYIQFMFKNESDKAAGAFTVHVRDQLGAVVKTQSFSGLGPRASTSFIVHAPYACGWSRTARLDATNAVVEYDESNNDRTYSNWCPRGSTGGLLLP